MMIYFDVVMKIFLMVCLIWMEILTLFIAKKIVWLALNIKVIHLASILFEFEMLGIFGTLAVFPGSVVIS